MLLLSPLSLPHPQLPSSLCSRSPSLTSHTDEQMLPRDGFHINDYWPLTPNEPPVWSMQNSSRCWTHLSRGAEAGFGLFFKRGNPWYTKWMNWGEVRTYPLEQRRNTTVSGRAMRGRPSKPADRKKKGQQPGYSTCTQLPLVSCFHSF